MNFFKTSSLLSYSIVLGAFLFLSNSLFAQGSLIWETYSSKDSVLIEYCFKENNPTRTYKAEYLLFKVTNLSSKTKLVSWDFSATYNSEKCLNCNSNNPEFHFQNTIKPKSIVEGNVNRYNKGPLEIFYRFTDEKYTKKNTSTWKSFELKNITIN